MLRSGVKKVSPACPALYIALASVAITLPIASYRDLQGTCIGCRYGPVCITWESASLSQSLQALQDVQNFKHFFGGQKLMGITGANQLVGLK